MRAIDVTPFKMPYFQGRFTIAPAISGKKPVKSFLAKK
jgi:hypothetical protein